jgi:hypothetical protein
LDYKLSFLLLLLGPIGALGGPAILALIENKIENSVEDKYGKDLLNTKKKIQIPSKPNNANIIHRYPLP